MNKNFNHSSYLNKRYRNNSFILGMGSILNLFGNDPFYTHHPLPYSADHNAIKNDWIMIAGDIKSAMKSHSLVLDETK